jgi:hypothetical protein
LLGIDMGRLSINSGLFSMKLNLLGVSLDLPSIILLD